MAFLVTGACFVIFNASLKAGGPTVRWSIVEDGVMIQVGLSKGWEKWKMIIFFIILVCDID